MKPFLSVVSILFIVEGIRCGEKDGSVIIFSSPNASESNYIVKNVDDVLELTCASIKNQTVGWMLPKHLNDRALYSQGVNGSFKVTVPHLLETDTGDYICGVPGGLHEVVSCSPNGVCANHNYSSWATVHLFVKKKTCLGFQCSPTICISDRYICDGHYDCSNKEDESPDLCGLNPCVDKIRCNGRCIPQEWCCIHVENCTRKWEIACCPDSGSNRHDSKILKYLGSPQHYNDYFYKQHNNSNVTFFHRDLSDFNVLQTLIHTVIGCALVLVVIGPIIVIGVCRLYMRHRSFRSCRQNAHLFVAPGVLPRRSTYFSSVTYHPSPQIEAASTEGFHSYDLSDEELPEQNNNARILCNNLGNIHPPGPPPYYEAIYSHRDDDQPPPYVSANNPIAGEEHVSRKILNV